MSLLRHVADRIVALRNAIQGVLAVSTGILPYYEMEFQPLSKRHEGLLGRTENLLLDYAAGTRIHPTYALIGTFGAGKTQLLYHLHRSALLRGLVPIHILAEDLFDAVIRGERLF